MPMIAAVVVVVAIIAAAVAMSSGGGEKKRPTPTPPPPAPTPAATGTQPPAPPQRPPPPAITEAQKRAADGLIDQIKEIQAEGDRLYAEAGKAKAAGDDDLWQTRLEEAARVLKGINDLWNDLVGQMPSLPPHWDEEEVANHHFPREADAYQKAMKRMGEIQKDRRG
jgi:hypothetical protein